MSQMLQHRRVFRIPRNQSANLPEITRVPMLFERFYITWRLHIVSLVFRYSYMFHLMSQVSSGFLTPPQKNSNQNPWAKLQKVSPFASCQVWKHNKNWLPRGWDAPPRDARGPLRWPHSVPHPRSTSCFHKAQHNRHVVLPGKETEKLRR